MIARTLAPDPSVLLLDEPIANLDPLWQLLLLDEFRRLAHDEGKALLVAIHDLRAAVEWSDRLILMSERQIRADAAPSELVASGLVEQVFGVKLGADLSLRQADRQSSPGH
jgi:ABC-type cobalamin/Fe3+-siderophores transport system ATPase subunit